MSTDFLSRLNALGEISKQKLVDILDKIPGKFDFIIESTLMKSLEKFIGASVLKSHGVDKIYKLEQSRTVVSDSSVVYLISADLICSKHVCDQLNSQISTVTNVNKTFHIIFVPKLLVTIEKLFEEEGLYGRVTFHVLAWELMQIDTKILSFEYPALYKQLFIHNDLSLLSSVAKSLWSLQYVFGKIPMQYYHGRYSKCVSDMLETMFSEIGEPDKVGSEIGFLLVVDRDIDYPSVLLTPGTYTSLVADILPFKSGVVEISKVDQENKTSTVSMLFSSNDEIYYHIKNKHFSEVFLYLRNKIRDLNNEAGKRSSMTLKEMTDFVKNKLSHATNTGKALANHLQICEIVTKEIGQQFESLNNCQDNILLDLSRSEIISFIEDLIATSNNQNIALRLISLLSLTQDGVEDGHNLKTQFLHAYGYDHLTTFFNLEKLGLFQSPQPSSYTDPVKLASKVAQVVSLPKKRQFHVNAQRMKLFPNNDNYDLKNPSDLGYVFGGSYIPVVAQFVNFLLKKESSVDDVTRLLPQTIKHESKWVGRGVSPSLDISPNSILVYFVGGITYSEIAALQLLEMKTGCRIIAAGSSIITGNSLVQAAM